MTVAELEKLSGGETPFSRSSRNWHGHLVSIDGTPATDFTEADVADVVCAGATGVGDWDGDTAAVLRLHDGRFVAYESGWGPTGSGFCEDAYGGDTDLLFAASYDVAVRMGLTEAARALCGVAP